MIVVNISRVASLSRTRSAAAAGDWVRHMSSGKKLSDNASFRPRRKSSRNYRPVKTGKVKKKDWSPGNNHKFVDIGRVANPQNELEAAYGPLAAGVLEDFRHRAKHPDEFTVEDELRLADYWTAESGTGEEMAFERRALARDTAAERQQFLADIDEAIRDGERLTMDFADESFHTYKKDPMANQGEFDGLLGEEEDDDDDEDNENRIDPNQLAHGEWSEMLVGVNRGIKLWRGGRLESYRALMIGGNCNGCAGFGIGKSPNALRVRAEYV